MRMRCHFTTQSKTVCHAKSFRCALLQTRCIFSQVHTVLLRNSRHLHVASYTSFRSGRFAVGLPRPIQACDWPAPPALRTVKFTVHVHVPATICPPMPLASVAVHPKWPCLSVASPPTSLATNTPPFCPTRCSLRASPLAYLLRVELLWRHLLPLLHQHELCRSHSLCT